MSEFRPITTLPDLLLQDDEEMTAGYWAGRAGEPEPGNLFSRAYWHGWCNGAADAGYREISDSQLHLRALFMSRVVVYPTMLQ